MWRRRPLEADLLVDELLWLERGKGRGQAGELVARLRQEALRPAAVERQLVELEPVAAKAGEDLDMLTNLDLVLDV